MKVVELKAVSKSLDQVPVLQAIDLAVSAGERLVIFGPSGCGKTTLLRLVAGFLAPDVGSLVIGGELAARDGRSLIPPERRNIGMVFQNLALWPHFSVRGNIEFGLKARGLPRPEREQRVAAMLKLVGLENLARRKPGELSGGQQQRVALARALAPHPDLVLLDEPLSSLDPALNDRMRKEIVRLQETLGFTLIHVTHNREEADEIATRLIGMEQGSIVERPLPANA
ncbi:MAG TPA: ABC transporter ATP-binding protein [Gammaproteobacteria bacterium]|nr:ABC transporter ATP-binding protein [Gammaproteobacteria bacterium]